MSQFLPASLRQYLFPYQLLGAEEFEMTNTRTKIGHGLAKVFNIKLQKNQPYEDELTRGESVVSSYSGQAAETYVEPGPTTEEYFRELVPTPRGILNYLLSLFPFLSWITKYNFQWLFGDLVAGKSCSQSGPPVTS